MKNKPTPDALLVAIRAKCMDCSGNCRNEVERCKLKNCPLFPYRNIKAVGRELERRTEIDGQINWFDVITTKENAI